MHYHHTTLSTLHYTTHYHTTLSTLSTLHYTALHRLCGVMMSVYLFCLVVCTELSSPQGVLQGDGEAQSGTKQTIEACDKAPHQEPRHGRRKSLRWPYNWAFIFT